MINRIDHIAIAANDFEKTIEFYEKIFGFKVFRKWTYTKARFPGIKPESYKLVYMYRGKDVLEIVPLRSRTPGLTQICFTVDNLDEEIDKLKKLGMEVSEIRTLTSEDYNYEILVVPENEDLKKIAKPPKGQIRVATFSDPNGVRLEFIER